MPDTPLLQRRQLVMAAALSSITPLAARAQSASAAAAWPAAGAVINWVVPYPAGGSTDVLGRNIGQRISTTLGAKVIVHNKPGATGTLGAASVAKAAGDGLTLLGTSIGPSAIAPHLMAKLPYDPLAAFAPVVLVGEMAHVLVTASSQSWRTLGELLAAARAQNGQLAYASGGAGTILHMQGELLAQRTGLEFIHAPYQGDAPALQDTLGAQVAFLFAPTAAALPHIRSGKLRALAVTAPERIAALPDVPTMAEAGVADFTATQWQAVFAPAATPAPIVARLNSAINAALQTTEIRQLADKLGLTLLGGSPEQLRDRHRADYQRWGEVIRRAGITAQ